MLPSAIKACCSMSIFHILDSKKAVNLIAGGISVSLIIGFVGFFVIPVFATSPTYSPGETLDPTCGPTDPNCTVDSTIAAYFTATSTTATSTFAGAIQAVTLKITGTTTLSNITGSAQCLHVDTNGVVSGTASDCSSGGATWTQNVDAAGYSLSNLGTTTMSAGSPIKVGAVNLLYGDATYNNYFFGGAGNLTMTGTYNVASGYQALLANTTGTSSTAVGAYSLQANTSGSNNTASGYQALLSNTTGLYNTAFGASSLQKNTTASNNTAIGFQSLFSSTTGSNNTASGVYALRANTSGHENVADGMSALFSNTSGFYNTATGYQALYTNTTGSYNTAAGYQSLYGNTSSYNTGFGYQALKSTTGGYNTAVGHRALESNTSGYQNNAIGDRALLANTEGYNNIANGTFALTTNSTGYNNVANGVDALFANTTGYENAAYGYFALVGNTTGTSSTAIGSYAGNNNSTGTRNVFLGASAGYYETGSNAFYVDTYNRTNTAGDKVGALLYGTFNATPASQTLVINAATNINNTLSLNGLRTVTTRGTATAENLFLGQSGNLTTQAGDNNIAAGYRAGYALTSGNSNILIGYNAGYTNQDGANNIMMGYQAGYLANGADDNVFVGGTAGYNNTTGDANTVIGKNAGYGNQTGSRNVFIGTLAGFTETGSDKLFIDNRQRSGEADGRIKSLIYGVFDNDPAVQYVAINGGLQVLEGGATPTKYTIFRGGDQSADLTYTLPTGYPAVTGYVLSATTGGVMSWVAQDSAVNATWAQNINAAGYSLSNLGTTTMATGTPIQTGGVNLLYGDVTWGNYFFGGAGNMTMGGYSGGWSNTAGGYGALDAITIGNSNVAYGYGALTANTRGSYNMAIGNLSLNSDTTGAYNTAVGAWSLLDLNITADNFTGANTAIGYNTGRGIVTGVNNTIIGANVTGLAAALSNNIIIADGTGAQRINVDASGNVGIGTTSPISFFAVKQSSDANAGGLSLTASAALSTSTRYLYMDSVGVLHFNGQNDATLSLAGAWVGASDRAYKDNIVDLSYGLDTLMQLQPRSYTMKAGGTPQIGFIAQEIKSFVPEVVEGTDGHMGISYGNLTAVLVKAIQELNAKVDAIGTSTISAQSLGADVSLASSIVDWVGQKITAVLAVFDTVQINKGLEIKDTNGTGDIYCVTITNGEWNKFKKVNGTCENATEQTATTTTTPSPSVTPPPAQDTGSTTATTTPETPPTETPTTTPEITPPVIPGTVPEVTPPETPTTVPPAEPTAPTADTTTSPPAPAETPATPAETPAETPAPQI